MLIQIGVQFKRFLPFLTSRVGPSEKVRRQLRRLKPQACPCCAARGKLEGHGWRSRSILESWSQWGTLWYWRVRCVHCGSVIQLVFDVSYPKLFYAAAVILAVVMGRIKGKPKSDFNPHHKTQKRWMKRFRFWWQIAQASGAVDGSLESWARGKGSLREAVRRCAANGISLVAPVHTSCTKTTPYRGYRRPIIAAHQRCRFTVGATEVAW